MPFSLHANRGKTRAFFFRGCLLMDHELKPHWFIRLLSWIDFSIEALLALVIFIVAAFLLAMFIDLHGIERFLAGLLFGGRH